MTRVALWSVLILAVGGCAGSGDLAPSWELRGVEDSGEPEVSARGEDTILDAQEGRSTDQVETDVVEVDLGPPVCQPGAGCFLDPCDENGDCLSSLCVGYLGNSVCTQQCIEECPAGWECKQLVGLEPDIVFACISPYTHLCRPCHTANDCRSFTGEEDACVSYGAQGSFCGADCSPEQPCPAAYSCVDAATSEGGELQQCVPDVGLCECSAQAVSLGLSTKCYVENEWGTCTGTRTCGPDGLSDCDAPVPAEEVCNGVDDDCNNAVDDVSCDDGDECTVDECDPAVGCTHEPLTGTDCSDDNVCTLADHCEDAECVGTPIDCNDDDICTTDECDPAGGCIYTFNNAPCDDVDPCTVNDACLDGACTGFPVPCDCQEDADCALLEDMDVCNGTLYCDVEQFPQKCSVVPETIVTCEAPEGLGAECLVATCDAVTGECSFEPANDGGLCDDGNACTLGETCATGSCQGGVSLNCNDDNPCTTDLCDGEDGCVHENNSQPCEDGNVCTVADFCAQGACVSGEALVCNDANQCTADSCVPATGCAFLITEGPCDDGNTCTTLDTCVEGKCVGSGSLECDDGNQCTKDICLPDGGCGHENLAGACSDGDPCTVNDSCQDGVCVSGITLTCDDSNPCTDDACKGNGLCSHEANEAACDDANLCTSGDHCLAGGCVGGEPVDCDDDEVCTTDTCNPKLGCLHSHNVLPCDDGNICTLGDLCGDGVCAPGTDMPCDDGNLCTDDDCNPETGCTHTHNQESCDDANFCTENDTCTNGFCLGLSLTDCSDDNICTDDTCEPLSGCAYQANTNPCTDQNICTLSDACLEGQCVSSGELICNDGNACTDDSCDPLTACVYVPNSEPCNDGTACTQNDVCQNGECLPGNALDCDDSNLCTDDSCDPLIGCVHVSNADACDDGSLCTEGDFCQDAACVSGSALDCDDGDHCTEDSCEAETGCAHLPVVPCCGNGAVEAPEECDDGNNAAGDGCDADCAVEPPVSCKILLELLPASPTGTYAIDPDGEGGDAPFDVYCDMETDGGGWTRVAFEDFESPTTGWSTTNTITACGTYGNILGGYCTISTATNAKTYDLLAVPHTHVRLDVDYIKIDSWDSEYATVKLDGVQIYQQMFCFCSQGCQNQGWVCGGDAVCGGGWDEEHKLAVTGTVEHTQNSVEVFGDSSIDQDACDESWGFDNVRLYVR